MTDQAIREIERLTREAETVLTVPSQPYLLRQPDGAYKEMIVELRPENLRFFSLESLCSVAKADNKILVAPNFITLLIDDDESEHRALHSLDVPYHPVFKILREWQDSSQYDQKKLVRLLRTKLAGYVDPAIAARFEKIKVTVNGETERKVCNGVDAIGKSLEQKALFNGEKPVENFLVTCPVFDIPEMLAVEAKILVQVEIEPDPLSIIVTSVYKDIVTSQIKATDILIEKIKALCSADVFRASIR